MLSYSPIQKEKESYSIFVPEPLTYSLFFRKSMSYLYQIYTSDASFVRLCMLHSPRLQKLIVMFNLFLINNIPVVIFLLHWFLSLPHFC